MRGVVQSVAVAVAIGIVASLAAPAHGQDEEAEPGAESHAHDQEARALYEAGRVAFDDGRFDDALGYFERSHELSGRPQLLFNIGSAADRLRQNDKAIESFEAYLEALPDAPNRRSVEARLSVLREAVANQTTVPTPEETAEAGMTESEPGTDLGDAPPPSRTGLWIGIGVGAAVLVATAIVLGIVLANRDPEYANGTILTLEATP